MEPDERTPLLVKTACPRACSPDERNGKFATSRVSEKFALWQIGALCGILLAYADTSLVWATHETVASHFNNLENSSWMMTSFTIGYCVSLPLYGRMSDNYGRFGPLIAAYCTFCIGCTFCGIGQAYWTVILGRITQGCGASGIISLASIIITDIAAPSDVAVLRSYVNIASTVGLSLGGPLGGYLGGSIGWRWSFLGQVPIAALCCALLARVLRPTLAVLEEGDSREYSEHETDIKTHVLTFDYSGAITLAIWISSFLAVIDLQNQLSWGHPLVWSLATVGLLAMVAFLALETYPGNRELLVPLHLLKTEVGVFCVGQLLVIGSCHGFSSQIAPYFSNTQGASDAEGGFQIILPSLGTAIGSLIAGQAIKKFESYKKLSVVSLVFCVMTTLLILVQWSHSISRWEALTTFPYGLFAGIVLSTQFIGLYHCAPKQHMATAISMYYMSQQIGIALGISIFSAFLKQEFKANLQRTLVAIPDYQEIIRKILMDSSLVSMLPNEVRELVWRSYLNSFWVVPALATSAQALAILPMIFTTGKVSN